MRMQAFFGSGSMLMASIWLAILVGLGSAQEAVRPPAAEKPAGNKDELTPAGQDGKKADTTASADKPPVPAPSGGSDSGLRGYCPVSYHTGGMAIKGDPAVSVEYQGFVYFFAGADKKKEFEENPEKYLPRIGGLCTVSLGGPYGNRFRGDPAVFAVVDGKLYLSSSERAKRSFDKDPSHYINRAEELYRLPELKGICPVTYQTEGRAAKGHETYRQVYRAKAYHLYSEEAAAQFKKAGAQYVPQYDGQCADGVSRDKLVPGDPMVFVVLNGRTFLFVDLDSRARCLSSEKTCIPDADAKWPEVRKPLGKAPGGI